MKSSVRDLTVGPPLPLISFAGNQLKQLLRAWLSPTDPSTNHIIARKAQHKGTAVWLFQGMIFVEWKSTGSLLWIHGKRAFLSSFFGRAPSDRLRYYRSGLWEKRHLVCSSLPPSCLNLFFSQFLRRPRHHGRMRCWNRHHGLLLLRFQGYQKENLSRSAAFSRFPAFYSLQSLLRHSPPCLYDTRKRHSTAE
jgi:hypothetical protein